MVSSIITMDKTIEYIDSIIDEPNTKVKLVEGVYCVTVNLISSDSTSMDALSFKQINITERINNKLKTYLPSDMEYKVFVCVKPNLIVSQRGRRMKWKF